MVENVKTGTCFLNSEEIEFNYLTSLNAKQKMQFVEEFGNLVVSKNNYYKIVSNMMFDFMVIRIFTNIDTSFVENGEYKISSIENIVNANIAETVKSNVEVGVIDELRKSCELNVEYKTGIHKNLFDEALAGIINTLDEMVKSFDLKDVMDAAKMFSGMSDELTAEKLLAAYEKSDMYKKNWGNTSNSF